MDRGSEITPVRKPFEILHNGSYDIVVNKTATDQSRNDELLKKIISNISESKEPLAGWVKTQPRIKIDNGLEPRYISKEKWLNRERFDAYRKHRIGDAERIAIDRHEDSLQNSLLNEMSISGRVKEIINDKTGEIARMYGYTSIKFAEPLIGLIDRKSGEKTKPPSELTVSLDTALKENGILPHDLNDDQFMVCDTPEGKILYLIDIEGYEKS